MNRKKILLIEPAKNLADKNLETYYLGKYYSYRHLGLASIKAALKNKGHKVVLLPSKTKNWHFKFKKTLLESKFDFIGISTTSYTIEQDMNLAFFSRRLCPTIPIIMGGYYAWSHPLETLKKSEADIVIRGMGEYPLMKLVQFNLRHPLKKDKAEQIKNIPGICLKFLNKKQKESYLINPPFIASEKEINKLPLPEPDKERRIQTIYTSFGCIYKCKFCSVPYFYGKMIYLSTNKVISWIKKISDSGYRIINIADPDFNLNRKRVWDLCNEIIKTKKKGVINKSIIFRCQARIGLLDNELLDQMKKAGFKMLLLGIETISSRLLKDDLDKGGLVVKMTFKEINNKIQKIAKKGMSPYIYLILGLPNSSKKDVIETMKSAQRWRNQRFGIDLNLFVTPYPETRYFQEYKNSKIMVYRNCQTRRFDLSGSIKTIKFKIPYYLDCKNKEASQTVFQIEEEAKKIFLKNKRIKFEHAVIKAAEKLDYI